MIVYPHRRPGYLREDPDFCRWIYPITENEWAQCERQALGGGLLPVIAWDGIILAGWERVKYASQHRMPLQIIDRSFSSARRALLFALIHQRTHRILTNTQRAANIARERLVSQSIKDDQNGIAA